MPASRFALALTMALAAATAHAQLGDLLKSAPGGTSGGSTGALGTLGSLSPSSVSAGTAGNAAGVIEYCLKKNYLSADNATSAVKDKLLGSVSGGTSDAGYGEGSRGMLSTSSGSKLDLSGGGLKAEITKQVCEKILAQGKSML
ncbi:DUF2501 domain-containing protein [Cupriavidus agavae]|uniref:Uncharacterized protein DUF2501 n=1 Tax=Cupriavidus agavae TaxID=1001822 RepID=A0A4V2FI10_9BURK|nr:DUF2501 domain-containing protein [Cupriavidus agavae]RZT42149.1 uncharacterized protein DUF2501 [Cupriavidus agavae]